MDTVTIPAGTLIHVGGFPFRTITDTTVKGNETNLKLGVDALAESAHVPKNTQAGDTGCSA